MLLPDHLGRLHRQAMVPHVRIASRDRPPIPNSFRPVKGLLRTRVLPGNQNRVPTSLDPPRTEARMKDLAAAKGRVAVALKM